MLRMKIPLVTAEFVFHRTGVILLDDNTTALGRGVAKNDTMFSGDRGRRLGDVTVLVRREHFNILKFYTILHYFEAIRALGSPNGYNSDSRERLHIDFAKAAYNASNKHDYTEQMTLWLQRLEPIPLRASFLVWERSQIMIHGDAEAEIHAPLPAHALTTYQVAEKCPSAT
ncbi:hypothetical protein Hypma_010905 [Hypsizygus marmoreus]|uniref:Uncharacterized protein n=1 Tax=Hypsizygus marmoreus TaxID=39966 RepID=A0A369JMY1_HYPMA|nr:hypothetical protein Hypma_010905 [Hypsizygus marmoreus]